MSHTDLIYQQIYAPDIVMPRGTIQNHMCSILRLIFNDVQNTSQISGASVLDDGVLSNCVAVFLFQASPEEGSVRPSASPSKSSRSECDK